MTTTTWLCTFRATKPMPDLICPDCGGHDVRKVSTGSTGVWGPSEKAVRVYMEKKLRKDFPVSDGWELAFELEESQEAHTHE